MDGGIRISGVGHMKWATHGVGYLRSWIHTEWDTHGVGNIRSGIPTSGMPTELDTRNGINTKLDPYGVQGIALGFA